MHLSSLQERRYPALSALQNCDKNKIVAPKNFGATNLKRQKIANYSAAIKTCDAKIKKQQ